MSLVIDNISYFIVIDELNRFYSLAIGLQDLNDLIDRHSEHYLPFLARYGLLRENLQIQHYIFLY